MGYRGNAPAPGPQAEGNWRLSRIRRIRETAKTATKKRITLVPASCTEAGGILFCLLTVFSRIVFRVASSFSTVRKKQRAPEGAADFPPRTSAPSGFPPPPHGTRGLSCLPAQRPRRGDSWLYSLLFVGAPLASGLASLPELRVIG